MSAHWHIGMEVVCVKRGDWSVVFGPVYKDPDPTYGEVCIIAALDESPVNGEIYVGLRGYAEFNRYHAGNFRPVDKRKTDISIFTGMLKPSKVEA